MKVLLILKIGRGKVTNFSEVTKFFPDFFFPDKVYELVHELPNNLRIRILEN